MVVVVAVICFNIPDCMSIVAYLKIRRFAIQKQAELDLEDAADSTAEDRLKLFEIFVSASNQTISF